MSTPTRLPDWQDISAAGMRLPVTAEVTMHDPDGDEYLCRILCGFPGDIVPAAERMAEARKLDLGVSDWAAR